MRAMRLDSNPRELAGWLGLAVLCCAAGLAQTAGPVKTGQAQAGAAGTQSGQTPPPAHRAGHAVKHKPHASVVKPPVEPVAALPAAPPPPDWPVNDKPVAAAVSWDGRDLSIAATNSSLSQILADVSVATGMKVDGSSGDQRIYGQYGPAPARDVLSQLLEGSGYNVVLIGDKGQGTPRELVLTMKTRSAPTASQGRARVEEDVVEEPEPPAPEPQPEPQMRRRPMGVNPPAPGRPEELQQQQQQMQQQIQQQQQQQPQQNPPNPNN